MPKGHPYELPDDQCEYLRRSEMQAVQRLMALGSDLQYAKEDLHDRLDSIPSGNARMNMIIGGVNSLMADLIGTVSDKQRRQLRNTARDFQIEIRPRMVGHSNRVPIDRDELRELTDLAREKCKDCVEDGETARKCRLFKWLVTNIPLDDYGAGLMCPYANIGWGE